MKWLVCKGCGAEWPVSDEDDTIEANVPCDYCGARNWTYQQHNEDVELLREQLKHMGHWELAERVSHFFAKHQLKGENQSERKPNE